MKKFVFFSIWRSNNSTNVVDLTDNKRLFPQGEAWTTNHDFTAQQFWPMKICITYRENATSYGVEVITHTVIEQANTFNLNTNNLVDWSRCLINTYGT